MKIILLFLAALASFTVHAQPPSQTVEQTVRHIYQNYGNDSNLLIVFYVQIMPDDFVMQLHRF